MKRVIRAPACLAPPTSLPLTWLGLGVGPEPSIVLDGSYGYQYI